MVGVTADGMTGRGRSHWSHDPPMVRAPVKSFPIKTQVAVSGDGPVPGHACISGPALPRRGSCESGEMGFLMDSEDPGA